MRKIRPQTSYKDADQYPSVIDTALSRRAFLKGALTTTAAAGALLVPDGAGLVAGGRRPKTYRTAVKLSRRYQFRYGNYQVQRITVQTTSAALVRFIENQKESAGIEKAVRKILDAHTCADLKDGKKLARLQRRVAKVLAARYRKRKGSRVRMPTVVLFVGLPGVSCKGDCPAPVAICKPPATKRPRRRPRR